MTEFRPLTTRAELDALLEASHHTPVILFKHSQSCGFSHVARASLAEGDIPGVVHQVVVQQSREISEAIADTLGVRHHSPQLIVVAAGRAAWHASHAGVTAHRLTDAFERASVTLTPVPAL